MQIETSITFSLSDHFLSHLDLGQLSTGVTLDSDQFVLWGPYVEIPAGKWHITVTGECRGSTDLSFFEVCEGGALTTLQRCGLVEGQEDIASATFTAITARTNVEFRIFSTAGTYIRIAGIKLQRVDEGVPSSHLKKLTNSGRNFELYKRDGFQLLLDESSWVDYCLVHSGTWEHEQILYLKQLTAKCSTHDAKKVFLDIGSYFGLYSLHMARVDFFDEIIAFEADTFNYRQLQANLLINDPDFRIKSHNFAVADRDGEAYFYASWKHPDQNRGGVGLLPDGYEIDSRVRVEIRALDNFLDISNSIIFSKLDVEGYELGVLHGMEKILKNNQCVLQVEALLGGEGNNEKISEVDEFLKNCGYTLINSINPDNYYSNFLI